MTNLNNRVTADIYIQARMGSIRLPGKTLLPISDTNVLELMVQRVKQSTLCRNIVILTTNKEEDNQLVDFAKNHKIEIFRGSENDLISRYLQCAKIYKPDVIVRLTGDCPFIDHGIIDKMLNLYMFNWPNIDFMTNCFKRTFARGFDVELLSLDLLTRLDLICDKAEHREHIVPYLEENTEKFNFFEFPNDKDDSGIRLTIDTLNDYRTICQVYDLLPNNSANYREIIKTIYEHPHIIQNNKIQHKSYYE